MIHTITKLVRKEGQSANGNLWLKISIQTDKSGQDWLSGFEDEDNADWKVGDVVDLDIIEVEKYGTVFKNYVIIEKPVQLSPESARRIKEYHAKHNAMIARMRLEGELLPKPPF